MKILVLGGTIFYGRAFVEAALAKGHEFTLFHRGKHNPGLFPEVETIQGDRNTDLHLLKGRNFDAVLDTCGYFPRAVRESAMALADSVGHYSFISSISVYADFNTVGIDEDYPVGTIEDPTIEEITGESYGPLKALCEQAAENAMPGRVLTIRPGLIVGPHDPSDRFTYWVERVAKGGKVLAPQSPDYTVEFSDVRDLAEWNLRMIEANKTGVFNASGPEGKTTIGNLLEVCKTVAGSDAEFVWLSEAQILANEIAPWMELPLWIPESEGAGLSRVNCDRAIAEGLTFRAIEDTVRDTLEWVKTLPADRQRRAGLPQEKEQKALSQPLA